MVINNNDTQADLYEDEDKQQKSPVYPLEIEKVRLCKVG